MSENYSLVTQYKGYINKADITNVEPGYLVYPSQNVVFNDAEIIQTRSGYSLFGAANSALTPILSSFDWSTSTNVERNLRKYDVELEYYYSGSWRRLNNTLFTATAVLNFRPWWDVTEAKDLLLFVDGTTNLYMWSGGVTTFASATANTITKEGTNTWAQDRFLIGGTRKVTIGAVEYTYTGGEGTTTLTGVTPDPTAGGHSVGDVVVQSIRVSANIISSSVTPDIIEVSRNQVYLADFNIRDVYVSKNSDYTLYTFSSPRLPGEGALLTLDSPAKGFALQEEDVYVSGNKSDWYKTSFTLSSDLTKEKLEIKKLKSGTGQAAYSQSSICKVKNSVAFFSVERVIDTLGRVENINTPQSKPLSDPIKAELLGYDLTVEPDSIFYRNQLWITFPSERKVLIYDFERQYWNPPQTLPVRKFAIISDVLCGHSSGTAETYLLNDGTNDNGFAINSIAAFAYRNYGKRAIHKDFDEWYTEGYISSNTILNLTLNYEYGGSKQVLSKNIEGDNDAILFGSVTDASLGINPLGEQPIGSTQDASDELSKFRTSNNFKRQVFFEIQPVYSSNEVDYQWKLLASGPNIAASTLLTAEVQS